MRKSLQPHVSRLQPYVLQVPLFANPASFARPPGQKIWLDEVRPMSSYAYTADVVSALRALHCIVCHVHIRYCTTRRLTRRTRQ